MPRTSRFSRAPPLANYKTSAYGKPTVLSFHTGACSGCGSEFAACGTWNGRVGAAQRVEATAAPLSSPSSERSGAAMRNASISIRRMSISSSLNPKRSSGEHSRPTPGWSAKPHLGITSRLPVIRERSHLLARPASRRVRRETPVSYCISRLSAVRASPSCKRLVCELVKCERNSWYSLMA